MFGRTRILEGGGSGLNSLGALLALQKHLKHDPNDYSTLPLSSPFSTIHSAVYTLLWSYMYTQQGSRRVRWLPAKAAVEGANNPCQRDPFIKLGHGWLGCLHLASHWSCGCCKIKLEDGPSLPPPPPSSHI